MLLIRLMPFQHSLPRLHSCAMAMQQPSHGTEEQQRKVFQKSREPPFIWHPRLDEDSLVVAVYSALDGLRQDRGTRIFEKAPVSAILARTNRGWSQLTDFNNDWMDGAW